MSQPTAATRNCPIGRSFRTSKSTPRITSKRAKIVTPQARRRPRSSIAPIASACIAPSTNISAGIPVTAVKAIARG